MDHLKGHDPRVIGPYRVLGRIGLGGMGIVYLAEDADGRKVAIKLVRPELADDPAFRSRFRREVQSGQRVGGICTAKYLDADLESGQPYFVTEYIEGGNLADYVAAHGPLSGEQLIGLAVGLAEAVVAMHASGVIHRDLKPTNVLMAPAGPKVVDFGISHAADGTALTQTGVVVGSPSWMAPEQAQGRETTPAVDVFSWGATVAFAATGRFPFGEGRPDAVIYRVVHEEPDLKGVDPKLMPFVVTALNKDPSARPEPDKLLVDVVKTAMAGDVPPGGSVAMTTVVLDRTWVQQPLTPPRKVRGRLITLIAASLIVVAATIGGALYITRGNQGGKAPSDHASGISAHRPARAGTTTTAAPTSTTNVSTAPSSTAAEVFAPWTAARTLAPGIQVTDNLSDGSCTIGSIEDAAATDAWRCFAGNGVYDPCFAPSAQSNVTQVACASSPWSGVDMMTLANPLPYSSAGTTGNTGSMPIPWYTQLANGDMCGRYVGTVSYAGGVPLIYMCRSGAAAGAPNTSSEPWTVQYLPNGSHVISEVAVTTAWN